MTQRPWRRTSEQFAENVRESLAWILGYMDRASEQSVWASVDPGEVESQLPMAPPVQPESLDAVLRDLQEVIEPGLVRWDAPGWFAWFPSNSHPDAMLGDLLASVTAQQGMLWASSPACTELETRMLEWLRGAMGLPECFSESGPGGGVIQDTASSAVLACMVAARDRATGGAATYKGSASCQGLPACTSEQAHSSVLKAAGICGIGRDHLRVVPTDASFCMDATALGQLMQRDVDEGRTPCFCAATVGTTGCGAIDPVSDIGAVCERYGVWLHVDAAWAGTAALSSRARPRIINGSAMADSWSFNPHKWLGASFDCSCLWVADRLPLLAAMSVDPEYLKNAATDSGKVRDYRDWHVQLGRRFRALKLWVLLRRTGLQAIEQMVDFHITLAEELESLVQGSGSLELAAPRSLSLLCIAHVDGNEATWDLIQRVNRSEQFAVTHCRLQDRVVMRVAIGALKTEREDVQKFFELISET